MSNYCLIVTTTSDIFCHGQEIVVPQCCSWPFPPSFRWYAFSIQPNKDDSYCCLLELPSTAWPCRIRHVNGQAEPRLVLCEPGKKPIFQDGIVSLRSRLRRIVENRDHGVGRLSEDEYMWEHNVAPATKSNWEIFRRPSFILPNEAIGEDNVYRLVRTLSWLHCICAEELFTLSSRK